MLHCTQLQSMKYYRFSNTNTVTRQSVQGFRAQAEKNKLDTMNGLNRILTEG